MRPDPSAYAVLGLEPGADAAQVEAAYRRLIKRHHPDRNGGSSSRAAEINSAYHELRKCLQQPALPTRRGPLSQPPSFVQQGVRLHGRERRSRRRWSVLLAASLAAIASFRWDWAPLRIFAADPRAEPTVPGAASTLRRTAAVEEPIDAITIEQSILDAVRLAEAGGEERLARQSRLCHQQLRSSPDLSRLDRCVAFDEAAVALLGRDPFKGAGPFSASAVTARQLAAASLLSEDALAAESRLARVRSYVALALAAPDPLQPG